MNANVRESIMAAATSMIVGGIVFWWEPLANAVGWDIHVHRSDAAIKVEYYIGLIAASLLGVLFPRRPVLCGVCLMFGPIVTMHSIYIFQHGVPNLWPVELMILTALTIPYLGFAYGGAYLRKRWEKKGI